MDINLERLGDNVYCDNTGICIDMTGVDEDLFWETAEEEYKYKLHIEGFRS
jgi:hypothetical protein